MIKVDEKRSIASLWRHDEWSINRRQPITAIGPASTLQEEGHLLRTRQDIRILHPSKEGEDGSVLLPECCGLHVIKDTDVPKNMTDTFCRPGMERKVLNANLGME
jgi:hypothetical protein